MTNKELTSVKASTVLISSTEIMFTTPVLSGKLIMSKLLRWLKNLWQNRDYYLNGSEEE